MSMLLAPLATGLSGLLEHRLRSALIVLTVAIGITAVTTTVALTDGLQAHVNEDIVKAGRAVSVVHRPLFRIAAYLAGDRSRDERLSLFYRDLADLARELPTARVSRRNREASEVPVCFVPAEIEYATVLSQDKKDSKAVLVGTVPDYRLTISYDLVAGRHLDGQDLSERRPVCVLDGGRAREIWGADVDPASCLGRRVELSQQGTRHSLEVVGILEEPFVLREKFKAFDTVRHARPAIFERLNLLNIYCPITLLMDEPRAGHPETVSIAGIGFDGRAAATGMLMYFRDCSNADIKAYERRISEWMENRNQAVFILSQWAWLDLVVAMVGDADIVGGLIWAVILGVTIVMILVINLVVVRERFREVAIRRTEGARRTDILGQFITESCLLSLLGGLLGLGGGVISARTLSEEVTGWPPEFSAGTFVLAIAAALAVGVLSTALPALQAARLDPVKVLSKP